MFAQKRPFASFGNEHAEEMQAFAWSASSPSRMVYLVSPCPHPPLSPCPGTPDYASTASLYENELGPRDDMESLAYTLLYLWMGKLPW